MQQPTNNIKESAKKLAARRIYGLENCIFLTALFFVCVFQTIYVANYLRFFPQQVVDNIFVIGAIDGVGNILEKGGLSVGNTFKKKGYDILENSLYSSVYF